MMDCMLGHPNLIVEWDFRFPVNQSYDYPGPYTVDRWYAKHEPEIIRRWREWKRMMEEWAEFLRNWSLPFRQF